MLEQIDNTWKASVLPLLEYYVDQTPRSFIEHKNFSLVWHYRKADPDFGIQRAWELKDELSDPKQRRLRELVEVLNKVEPRFGSELMAYAWYRSEPLPGFDGRTAMQLVQDGKAQQVLEYIDAVDAGVFA